MFANVNDYTKEVTVNRPCSKVNSWQKLEHLILGTVGANEKISERYDYEVVAEM